MSTTKPSDPALRGRHDIPAGTLVAHVPGAVRYTRHVRQFCHRGASLILGIVLAGLPVRGEVCARLCTPVNTAAASDAQQTSAGSCHEAESARSQLRGTAGHDCNLSDDHTREWTASLTAARADRVIVPAASSSLPAEYRPLPDNRLTPHTDSGAPPGVALPARPPIVLRI